ncbi:hypothetical protein SGL43_05936 [Streptomyces globisporus]|uniref:DUF4254 domain-containing protein n=1 Tax=Streptomyces globisporus TaxID=1908 RepID=A0ABM9H5K1_STRGL|nr:hypothetical protein SGL43_05936 [Streptomyces globisporus]
MMGRVTDIDAPEAMVARLLQELLGLRWPARLNSAERAGVDLVMLDSDIAGCVTSWLSHGGSLDAWRLGILDRKLSELERVLPELGEADQPRRWRLWHEMALLITDTGSRPAT